MSQSEKSRGQEAAREFRQLESAFAAVHDGLIAKFMSTGAEQTTTREACYHAMQGLEAVKIMLANIAAGADVEAAIEEVMERRG